MSLNEKQIERLIRIAISDFGLEAAPNRVRREAAIMRKNPWVLTQEGLVPQDVDDYLTEVVVRLEKMISAKRKK